MKAIAVLLVAAACHGVAAEVEWKALPSLPDPEGFAGMYAGVSNGVLLAAGGANFPGKKPWEGGTKIWYDTVWMLDQPQSAWRAVGALPSKRGYGVSIGTKEGLLCIGGAEADKHVSDCLLLTWKNSQLTKTDFPALPRPCANLSGALVGRTVHVAGGIQEPSSTLAMSSHWALDLDRSEAGWRELDPLPGPGRMLAVAASHEGRFFLFSGASLAEGPDGKPVRTYLKDAWEFTAAKGWRQLPDLPRAAVAAPTPAPVAGGWIHVLGGDDGSLVNFEPKDKHPGFPRTSLVLEIKTLAWSRGQEMKASLVTNPVAPWQGWHVLVSGEKRPGVRSPAVWGVR